MLDTQRLQTASQKRAWLAFREAEARRLTLCLERGVHTYVYGPAGSGKSTTASHVISKFNDRWKKALYVDCQLAYTAYGILREVIDQMNSEFVHKVFMPIRSNTDLLKRIKKEKEKYPELKAVVLDNLQALKEPIAVDDMLDIGFTVILISDRFDAIHKLSEAARSYLSYTIQFDEYPREQVVKIMQTKAGEMFDE